MTDKKYRAILHEDEEVVANLLGDAETVAAALRAYADRIDPRRGKTHLPGYRGINVTDDPITPRRQAPF
jgi:hypothetical protein